MTEAQDAAPRQDRFFAVTSQPIFSLFPVQKKRAGYDNLIEVVAASPCMSCMCITEHEHSLENHSHRALMRLPHASHVSISL